MKKIGIVLATLALAWTGSIQAGPVDLKNVPADAMWLAHVDFDAAHSSQVVEKFVEQCKKDFPIADKLIPVFLHKAGIDECRDLHGITVYGEKFGPHNGVLIVNAKWNIETLKEKAERAHHHKTVEYGKYKIHTFIAHKGTKYAHKVAATLYKPDVLVLASCPERLKKALDLLDGKGTSLAGKESPLAAKVSEGTVILARAIDLKDSKAAKMHPALELIQSFNYEKGEHDGKWFGNVAITADSKPTAEKVAKVVEGYGAWISLHAHNSPWFVEMLNKSKLSVDGNTVKVTFLEPADSLISHMPELCKAIHEHVKNHMKMMRMHCRMHHMMMERMHGHCSHDAKGKSAGHSSKCPMKKKEAGAATDGGTKK